MLEALLLEGCTSLLEVDSSVGVCVILNLLSKLEQLVVHTGHVGLLGPIIKRKTCFILFDIPPAKKDYFELNFLAVYEAKKDGPAATGICGVHSHKLSEGTICFSHLESRNCGNYCLVNRIPLGYPRYEIVGGEHIHVYFEITPYASIVVKMCQVQLFRRTPYTRDFSVDKIHGCKYGFDLTETSCRLTNKDEDSKRMIMEDEDQIINNKRDTKYIHFFDDRVDDNFLIKIVNTTHASIGRCTWILTTGLTGRAICQYVAGKVHNEHAGLPGRNKNISSPLFDIPETTEKKRTCSILFDIPPSTEKKDYFELKFLAVYEAKTDGSVSTSVNKVLDPHNASCYQCRRICFSHFKSRNCGNYSLVSRIPLEKEIVAGERIEVYFEIAPYAFIVVKICQVQLLHRPPYKGGFSVDKIHGHKIGFDLVETSSGLANNDYDSKRSSIWEDEDLMINNKMESEYIYLFDDKLLKNFIIESLNTAQISLTLYNEILQFVKNVQIPRKTQYTHNPTIKQPNADQRFNIGL
ncbi:hypothetical protein LguiA_030231 [Lonicera macranthoides]